VRLALVATCALLLLAPDAIAGTGGTAPGSAARLQGTWAMSGKVTRADNVRGEHKGQRLNRKWTFTSSCASGACSKVSLRRERSNNQFDKLTLKRSGSSAYTGSGKFYVRLKCNGRTYNRGGIAYYTIRLSVTKSSTVQSKRFATRISAAYNNTKRVNKTPCAGSIGRDAGTYTGKLTSAVPAPPTASFTFAETSPGEVAFADKSAAAKGARLVSWNWDFGDGSNSTSRSPSHHYSTGTYDVTLTVRDSNGLTGTTTQHLVVA
jgi:PKD repeat protein